MRNVGFAAIAALVLSAGLARAQVVITTDTTIAPGDPVYQNQDVIVRGCTVTINGAQAFSSLTVERGGANVAGVVTHSPTFSANGVNGMFITLTGDLVVQGAGKGGLVASRIDVSSKGFPKGQGPGANNNVAQNGARAPGGSYGAGGGFGGPDGLERFTEESFYPGPIYGDYTAPAFHGSGSGRSQPGPGVPSGASGGGAVHVAAGGTASIDGQILADGGIDWAGGSGGSIWITSSSFTGSGVVRARGGGGTAGLGGGGGGGGRIAIITTMNTFTGTLLASGGAAAGAMSAGGAGTLFIRVDGQHDQLIYDNAMTPAPTRCGSSDFEGAELTIDADVTVRNNARVAPRRGSPTPLHLTINGSLSVDATSSVGAPGRAPRPAPAGNGTPADGISLIGGGGGGGHGGAGGAGSQPHDGFGLPGAAHGDPENPVTFGGAGGNHFLAFAGRGGGALRLTVSGGILLNGKLTADGAARPGGEDYEFGGGGAGGSLWIEAPSITGGGFIHARGGNGSIAGGGGGGGGGRIRIDSCSMNIASTNISVEGGPPSGTGQPGQPGTVVTHGASTDWNGDGEVNSTDVSDFINDWFTDQVKGGTVTDFNNDGVSNSTDVSDFINAWFAQEAAC